MPEPVLVGRLIRLPGTRLSNFLHSRAPPVFVFLCVAHLLYRDAPLRCLALSALAVRPLVVSVSMR